jgi:hypothetical protein
MGIDNHTGHQGGVAARFIAPWGGGKHATMNL